ncbi:MAG: lamin tail domain-containing protein, partial [Chloroflexota bacterium]
NENRAWIESLQADLPTVPTSEPNVVLAKVYPDGLANNDMDEAILLKNLGSDEINLAGWGVSDDPTNPTKMIMPASTIIPPNGEIWITRNADAFQRQFGFPADYESGNSNLGANQQMLGNWPGFSNAGDEVVLANSRGEIVDALVYETGNATVLAQMGEWVGDSLPFSTVGAAEGQLLFRKLDPATGELLADTNGRSDWGQDPDDPVLGRQVQYPGWNVDRFFVPVEVQTSAALTIAVAPDNAFEAVANLIDKAQRSIQIESHTFESHDLLNHLKQAVQRGVQVDILLEGGPPGGLQDPQRWNCYDLEQAGGNCYIMQNDASNEVFDRYKFMHAKFMIVDGRYSAVSSDNLSPNSWPADDKIDGTFGRRGIVLITDEQSVANHLQSIFAADLDQANYSDIVRWQPSQTTTGFGIETYQIPEPQNAITYTVGFPELFEVREEMTFEIIQAPENYLNPTAGLFALLDAAGEGDTLLVEQQYERLYWGETDAPNLRLTHYISAARRGAEVKILLDSFFDDESHPASNKATCDWANQLANQERLELTCRTGNPTGLGIHNKMVLANISGKGYIHVGSINGSEQSAKANREVALQVASDEAYAFLESVFNRDFPSQIFIPIVTHEQNGAILRPLISEVLYNPFGSADDAEFIEIVNPSNRPIDISGYSLSDAITAEDYADLRRFPQGTVLPPKEVLVVAQQSKALEDQFFVKADFEILDSDPDVPELIDDLTWGDPSTFIRLSNVGDVIFLRDSANIPVDVLAYGEVQVDGYPICPAVTLAGASIRRIVVEVDSGSCSDFEEWGSPTPGQAP